MDINLYISSISEKKIALQLKLIKKKGEPNLLIHNLYRHILKYKLYLSHLQ